MPDAKKGIMDISIKQQTGNIWDTLFQVVSGLLMVESVIKLPYGIIIHDMELKVRLLRKVFVIYFTMCVKLGRNNLSIFKG